MTLITTPYWWDDAPPAPTLPTTPPAVCDLLVVGGGYTGLSAAIAARKVGASVAVVDSGTPGQGASTRNGGMCGAHSRVGLAGLTKSFGADTAVALLREAPEAFSFTRDLIAENKLDCDFEQSGRLQFAWTAADAAAQKELAEDLLRITGYKLEIVAKDDLVDHISTRRYAGGALYADHASLHPAKFHAGLLKLAMEQGASVVSDCPVLAVDRTANGFEVTTQNGTVSCREVVLATNGYTSPIFGWWRRRFFALPSFLIATEPLSSNLITSLAPGRRIMVETRAKHSYFRISPDGTRVLFGGRAGMVPISAPVAARRLRATMVDLWPALGEAAITHSWQGSTGFSFEQMPHVGVHNGIHFAMGYSGSGVAMAPYLGMKAALRALGEADGETAYSRTVPTTRLFHPGGRPFFLGAAELWYRQVVDRRQTAKADREQRRG